MQKLLRSFKRRLELRVQNKKHHNHAEDNVVLWDNACYTKNDNYALQVSLQISSPGEEQRVAAAPRRRLEKRLLFWGFLVGRINKGQGRAPGGVGPTQEGRWRGQELGCARHPPGCPLAALWPPFGPSEASRMLVLYIY